MLSQRHSSSVCSSVRRHERGVGLIEVLLAVVILSVGFLAAARMQVEGMRYSQGAYYLSQANFMLREMSDRMRANREGVSAGDYDGYVTQGGSTEPACVAAGTRCASADIAKADLHAWSRKLHAGSGSGNFVPLLPSSDGIAAEGRINLNAATGVYTIEVQWAEQLDGTDQRQHLSVQFYP